MTAPGRDSSRARALVLLSTYYSEVTRGSDPLSASELAELDARYQPFPPVFDWPSSVRRAAAWETSKTTLHDLKLTASADDFSDVLTQILRTAAFDTGAIEGLYKTDRGLTRTVAAQAALWEQDAASAGPGALALFEAQLAAYDLVLDVATQSLPVTEVWIRRLHEVLTGPQETYTVMTPLGPQEQPLPQGEYKRHPNHVDVGNGTVHAYAPVTDTAIEMDRLVRELRSPAFANAHPALQAAYAHYALVAIHPFADGNGRVARALASTYLYRDLSIPLLILVDERDPYFHALAAADSGDPGPFIDRVVDAARTAANLAVDTIRRASSPTPEEALTTLRDLMTTRAGLAHGELDAIAVRLMLELADAVESKISLLEFPAGIDVSVTVANNEAALPAGGGFRPLSQPGFQYLALEFASSAPARAREMFRLDVLVSIVGDEDAAFRVVLQSPISRFGKIETDNTDFELRDVYPQVSGAARYRLDALADRVLGAGLKELGDAADRALRGGQ